MVAEMVADDREAAPGPAAKRESNSKSSVVTQAPMTGKSGIGGLLGSVTLEKLDGSFVLFG
jgi:hypothetical protein